MVNPIQPPRASLPPTSRLSRETAGKAVDSLLKWIHAQAKNKNAQLLDHDELLHIVLTMKKIPAKGRTNPYFISLPHPLHSLDSTAICLFVDDRPKSPAQPDAVTAKLRADGIPITDVISLSSLEKDYKPYESKRKLCGSYDLFFADRGILPLLPRHIGKQFFKKKRHPLPIDLSHKSWKEQLKRSCESALLYLRTGTCCHLNVGRVSMEREEIVDNVIAAIEGAVARIPKQWSNVRSLHLKSDESVALPIYQALPEIGLKIDAFQKVEEKVVKESTDDREFIQGKKDNKMETDKAKKLGPKKGKIRQVRYMDTNLDEEGLISDQYSDGDDDKLDDCGQGENKEEETEEVETEKKKEKKTKKNKNKEMKVNDETYKKDAADKNVKKLDRLDDGNQGENTEEEDKEMEVEKKKDKKMKKNKEMKVNEEKYKKADTDKKVKKDDKLDDGDQAETKEEDDEKVEAEKKKGKKMKKNKEMKVNEEKTDTDKKVKKDDKLDDSNQVENKEEYVKEVGAEKKKDNKMKKNKALKVIEEKHKKADTDKSVKKETKKKTAAVVEGSEEQFGLSEDGKKKRKSKVKISDDKEERKKSKKIK